MSATVLRLYLDIVNSSISRIMFAETIDRSGNETITEILQGKGLLPVEWNWKKRLITAHFNTNNATYTIIFNCHDVELGDDVENGWVVNFYYQGSVNNPPSEPLYTTTNTNTGNEFQVYATVADCIKQVIAKREPNVLAGAGLEKRGSLYRKLALKAAKSVENMGYECRATSGGFVLVRKGYEFNGDLINT